jgi:hypothetical protein
MQRSPTQFWDKTRGPYGVSFEDMELHRKYEQRQYKDDLEYLMSLKNQRHGDMSQKEWESYNRKLHYMNDRYAYGELDRINFLRGMMKGYETEYNLKKENKRKRKELEDAEDRKRLVDVGAIEKDEKEKEKEKKRANNEKNEENESKKEQKGKKRVRGPNKCYRIIDDFFKDKKRAKIINENSNELNKEDQNAVGDEQINEEEKKNDESKNKRTKKRIKVTEMSEKFDEFLNFVNEKVNKDYYDLFLYPVINNYKEFYIEKEKEFKEKKNEKQNTNDEKSNNINNNMDENLARRKRSYGLENFLEIPEIVNDFVKYIYNKNIFLTDESKIEMIEIIFIFCTWLKQYHYSSYSIEYLIQNE